MDHLPDEKLPESIHSDESPTGMGGFLAQYGYQIAGFLGWYVINILIWLLAGTKPGDAPEAFLNLLLFPANVVTLIVLAIIKSTRRIAFGVVVALAFNLLVSLVMGVSYNAWCFIPFIFPTN